MVTNVDSHQEFQAMAVVYGFFFIFLSAIATMAPKITELYESTAFDDLYRMVGALAFYLLVLFSAMAMASLGGGLMKSINTMGLDTFYRMGFIFLMSILPLFYSLSIGFILHLDLWLILIESLVIFIYILWIQRKLR
jgi:hypothetical protein